MKSSANKTLSLWVLCMLVLLPMKGWATALTTQTISLQPGWNSIFVALEPDDGNSSTTQDDSISRVFNLPEITMVWSLPDAPTTIQYIVQPAEIDVGIPDWRVYIPAGQPSSALTNLHGVSAGRVYLVKLSGTAARTLMVQGRPVFKHLEWKPESFNLVGFYAHPTPAQQVTFADFLSIPTGSNPAIYQLSNGIWQLITKNALVEPGKGYWIYNDGTLKLSGPLDVGPAWQNGLSFSQFSSVKSFTFINRSGRVVSALQVGVQDFPLQYFHGFGDGDAYDPDWRVMHQATFNIDAGKDTTLLLAVDRAQLVDTPEGILTLSAAGMQLQLPLHAETIEPGTHGLWVGSVMLNGVSNVNAANVTATQPVDAPLTMKLLLHSSPQGLYLLKQVYLLGDYNVPDNVRTVLVTQDSALPNYTPLALARGKNLGYRLSSSAFDFAGSKLELNGNLAVGALAEGTLLLSPTLSTHPLLHSWHPDHDNRRDDNFEPIGANEFSSTFDQEVWEITRALRFQVETVQPASADSGLGRIVGSYQETITGMHKQPVVMSGKFFLERISLITDLDI